MNVEIGKTEHYNSVLEITRPCSFTSGNTYCKLESDIYVGFSPALHLQCTVRTYVQLRWVAESGRSTVGWAAVDDLKLLRTDDCMLMPHNAEPPTTASPPTTEAPPAGPFHLYLSKF
jgi:hypothetical protein